MLIQIKETAPTTNTDLLRNSVHRLSPEDRLITGAYIQVLAQNTANGIGASANANVALFVSDVLVADIWAHAHAAVQPNLAPAATGALDNQALVSQPAEGYNLYPVEAYVPAGSEIRAIVNSTSLTAADSLSIIVTIQLDQEDAGEDFAEMFGPI